MINPMYDEFIKLYLERERRINENRLKYYNCIHGNLSNNLIHKKQLQFHKDDHRIRWIFGGNRTGKTVSGAVETVWYARGNHPFKDIKTATRGWVVSLTNEVQRDVAQKEVLKWLNPSWIKKIQVRKGEASDPENAVIDLIILESVHGGYSTIGFKVCEQGREKFQGTSQHYIWFDEEPPKEIFDECLMRIVDTTGDVWGTMTPLNGLTWVYDTIYLNTRKDNQIKYWLMQWKDNPYLSQAEIKRMEDTLTEQERESRQFGRFVSVSGLVYKEFDEALHVIEPFDIPADWQDNISIDPGLSAPLSCHFYARDNDGCVYVVAEHYRADMSVEEHVRVINAIADELNWKRCKDGMLEGLIDSAAEQKTLASEKSVAYLFYKHGIKVNSKVNKVKWAGIQRVREYLKPRQTADAERYPNGKPSLFIFKSCENLIRELKSYRFKPNSDEPYKKDDHALDDLRYYIMSLNDIKKKPAITQSEIARHKDAMLRRLQRRRISGYNT